MQRARRALYEYRIEGISTTVPFHQRVLENAEFVAGAYDTHLIARM
jgi:acetyl-CoA carboxylase biotin carboxylase subunit